MSSNFLARMFTKFCEHGVSDRANFLKNTAVVGWALSSLAQTCSIFFNDKIPSKEKRFLIPQEVFDGLINATLFWFITSKAVNFGKLMVLKKYFLPKSIAPLMEKFTPKGRDIEKLKAGFTNHIKAVGDKVQLKIANDAIEGMGVATGIVGAIISNNIITPILRNKLASMYQKKEIAKMSDTAPLNPHFGNLEYSKYDFSKPRKTPTFGSYSGGMKI